jgi:tetratricopeptide (TPR) repeat protein
VRPSTWPPSPPCRRERGNEAFKAGDFPKALAEYSEAIKRDPDTAVYYVNRAAARTKLLDFSGALADCDKASGGSRQDDCWGWRRLSFLPDPYVIRCSLYALPDCRP